VEEGFLACHKLESMTTSNWHHRHPATSFLFAVTVQQERDILLLMCFSSSS
jgi:hypothetical protein